MAATEYRRCPKKMEDRMDKFLFNITPDLTVSLMIGFVVVSALVGGGMRYATDNTRSKEQMLQIAVLAVGCIVTLVIVGTIGGTLIHAWILYHRPGGVYLAVLIGIFFISPLVASLAAGFIGWVMSPFN